MLIERLETALAGRAAEEVVFGADDIGAGAGGSDTNNDLAVATELAVYIVCQSGLGEDGALRWTKQPTRTQDEQIDVLLKKAYTSIVERLGRKQTLLDRIAGVLEDKQEISGRELRRLMTR